jgi:hypothetical protein
MLQVAFHMERGLSAVKDDLSAGEYQLLGGCCTETPHGTERTQHKQNSFHTRTRTRTRTRTANHFPHTDTHARARTQLKPLPCFPKPLTVNSLDLKLISILSSLRPAQPNGDQLHGLGIFIRHWHELQTGPRCFLDLVRQQHNTNSRFSVSTSFLKKKEGGGTPPRTSGGSNPGPRP